MSEVASRRATAWLVFVLVAVASYGNYYVYDSIGPVADLLEHQRGFSNSQIGMLNAIYSLPNVVLVLVGGILVDRFGAARLMLWTAAMTAKPGLKAVSAAPARHTAEVHSIRRAAPNRSTRIPPTRTSTTLGRL